MQHRDQFLGHLNPHSTEIKHGKGWTDQGKRQMQGPLSEYPLSLSCSTADSVSVRNPGGDQRPSCHLDPYQDHQHFFFFKAVSCWSSYINLMALEEWLRSLSRQNKQQKYYFINRVLRMCFESTHHELITRWAEQSKRNSLDDKYQKGWFKKPSEMHSVSLLTQTTFSHFTLHGCAFCSVRFAWCLTGMRAWRCISNVNPC